MANPGNMKLASLEVTVVQNYNRPTDRLTGAGCRLYIVELLCSTAKTRIKDAFTPKGSTIHVGCQSLTVSYWAIISISLKDFNIFRTQIS